MTPRETAQIQIRQLGQAIGMPDLALDDTGYCALRFDESVSVHFQCEDGSERLLLYADLGPLPEANRHATYEIMLRGNLFWRATFGATLALSADEPPHAVLALPWDLNNVPATGLPPVVERFVNTAEDWAEALHGAEPDAAPAAAPPLDTFQFIRP